MHSFSIPRRDSHLSACDDCRGRAQQEQRKTMRLFKSALARRKAPAFVLPLDPEKDSGAISVHSIYSKELSSLDDDSIMSIPETLPASRPRSAHATQPSRTTNHVNLKRPNLAEILADQAAPPYSLEAFTNYASQNLCLENIEFVQDAQKYTDLYEQMKERNQPASDTVPLSSAQIEELKEKWARIILLYIAPSSPREVNIPGDIRSALSKIAKTSTIEPPAPLHLEPAVRKVYELIEDSVLFPFLNESRASYPASTEIVDEDLKAKRRSTPLLDSNMPFSFSPSTTFRKRTSTPSHISFNSLTKPHSQPLGKVSSYGHTVSCGCCSSAAASTTAASALTEDSVAEYASPWVLSPSTTHEKTVSPPRTPLHSRSVEDVARPPAVGPRSKSDGTWKKMGARLFRKRSGSNLKRHQRSGEGAIEEEQ